MLVCLVMTLDVAAVGHDSLTWCPIQESISDLTTLGRCFEHGGGVPRSSEAYQVMKTPAIHRAVQVLTTPVSLPRRQPDGSHLGHVRKSFCDSSGSGAEESNTISHAISSHQPYSQFMVCAMAFKPNAISTRGREYHPSLNSLAVSKLDRCV